MLLPTNESEVHLWRIYEYTGLSSDIWHWKEILVNINMLHLFDLTISLLLKCFYDFLSEHFTTEE